MVNPNGPGPSATKLNAAVQAIESLEAWKAEFEASTKKTHTFLRLKVGVLEEKLQEQAAQIRYLEEFLEIEVDEGGEDIGPGAPGDAAGNGVGEHEEPGAEGGSGEVGLTSKDGAIVKSEDAFETSKKLGTSKQIKVNFIYLLNQMLDWCSLNNRMSSTSFS